MGRSWCTYEAYLAYTLDKRIFCASSPVHGFWHRVVSQLGVCIVGLGMGAACWLLTVFLGFEHMGTVLSQILYVAMCVPVVACAILRDAPASVACRFSCAVAAYFANVSTGFVAQTDITFPVNCISVLVGIALSMCLEADRLWAVEAVQEKANLCSGYTGHVRDARCSVPGDGERIRGELRDQVLAVDHCVDVLIRTGLST